MTSPTESQVTTTSGPRALTAQKRNGAVSVSDKPVRLGWRYGNPATHAGPCRKIAYRWRGT